MALPNLLATHPDAEPTIHGRLHRLYAHRMPGREGQYLDSPVTCSRLPCHHHVSLAERATVLNGFFDQLN